ncbi:MAG: RNA pseudouridine synthase [Rickettsiales bacterium]|nr:RNA pseudouridine synthase [Rickettsiales bacterium]|tara:strand:- start:2856 stop:3935 length:1080 start_codon:yes stop_codon:yes gene_type:complete
MSSPSTKKANREVLVHSFEVRASKSGLRVDQFLAQMLGDYSRSFLQSLVDEGQATINEEPCRRSDRIHFGDLVRVIIPAPRALDVPAEELPLDIIYQDADIAVINKAVGMVVHPNSHDRSGTLVNALLFHIKDLSGINGVERPGIVHRIDKDTSGLLVVAKNDASHHHLSNQFRDHSIDRIYSLLCWHSPSATEGTITSQLGRSPKDRKKIASVDKGGKHAVTHYRVLESYGPVSLVECSLETGRTHQIRVHFAERNHPLVGDPVYGGKRERYLPSEPSLRQLLEPLRGQMLHASTLGFIHPSSDKYVQFQVAPPQPMLGVIEQLRSHAGLPVDGPGPWNRDPGTAFLGPGHRPSSHRE